MVRLEEGPLISLWLSFFLRPTTLPNYSLFFCAFIYLKWDLVNLQVRWWMTCCYCDTPARDQSYLRALFRVINLLNTWWWWWWWYVMRRLQTEREKGSKKICLQTFRYVSRKVYFSHTHTHTQSLKWEQWDHMMSYLWVVLCSAAHYKNVYIKSDSCHWKWILSVVGRAKDKNLSLIYLGQLCVCLSDAEDDDDLCACHKKEDWKSERERM